MPLNQRKVKFATQADPDLLENLRVMARAEGRQLQALVDEALKEYVDRKSGSEPRRHVIRALNASLVQYEPLYQRLAE